MNFIIPFKCFFFFFFFFFYYIIYVFKYTNKDIGVFVNKNNYMNLYETLTKYHKQNFNIIENNKYGKKKKKKKRK
ncbi:hypothetical protein PFUGPA_01922 [Plasmodium falciparum Palo Alto/Uganda]|uniref:Uncharacterized protein n=1 Tax=Plasmodium falciparum (isolate Palo Alto / Uganda) TaxID=57270 RepID=W4J2M9_PLAFP|nr:hypothetical protein PFUGPA_01922 [Plasmodium falciparum Palo Alto/Uganda]